MYKEIEDLLKDSMKIGKGNTEELNKELQELQDSQILDDHWNLTPDPLQGIEEGKI